MIELLKRNAYGARWHVVHSAKGIIFSGQTKRACMAYLKRHGLAIT